MSEVIFEQMLFSAIELAMFMFAVDETAGMSQMNVTAAIAVASVLLPAFYVCRYSANLTARLEAIGDAFYDYSWYCLKARQQRLLLLPIQRAQKSFRIKGLSLIDCSLEFFSVVNIYS